jgi:hypothetical protein
MRGKGRTFLGTGIIVILIALGLAILARTRKPEVLASVRIADGRVFQVEDVTYGTNHVCGESSFLYEHFRVWLPKPVLRLVAPQKGRVNIDLKDPALVVWVNALNPTNGNYVDCQGVRMEFVDEHGDIFAQSQPQWFGSPKFWRVGHVFESYPRNDKELTLRIVPWNKPEGSVVKLQNPHVVEPEKWQATAVPQRQNFGDITLELTRLSEQTNGGPKQYWESPARFWKPDWTLLKNGEVAHGWDEPDWVAQDPLGNRGQMLGIHQPMLRYTATVYPNATNEVDTVMVSKLPALSMTNVVTNWWNFKTKTDSGPVVALGFFPRGAYTFLEGAMVTNPPVRMSAVRGGAPTGWTGMNERVSPTRVKYWHGHYTDKPVVYISASSLSPKERLGLRLRAADGTCWLAKREEQGQSEGIFAFMIKLPTGIETVVPELVLLKPIEATFEVKTPAVAGK